MATTRALKLYRVRSPFIAGENGREIAYVDKTVIYSEDHPGVKRYFDSFEEVIPVGAAKPAPVVEAATANPGEQRTIST